ncbi:MAG: hypothetical protein IK092_04900 [Muribaculaceae bacterium]|nr:hypothetical protein [Muribaculaceae bacterium]
MKLKRLNTFLMALVLTAVVAGAESRPAVKYVRINGVGLESMKGKIYAIPVNTKHSFLDGVLCDSSAEIDKASFSIDSWLDDDDFTITLVAVKYANEDRPGENYVVTYKHDGGVIDAVLAYIDGDIAYGKAAFLCPNYNYVVLNTGTEFAFTPEGFTVKRSYKTLLNNRGGSSMRELGDWTLAYKVDDRGMITLDKDAEKWKTRTISTPNESVIGNTEEPREWTDTKTSTLSVPMLNLVKVYGSPLSQKTEPKEFEEVAKYVPEEEQMYGTLPLYKTTMEAFAANKAELLKRLMYRQPALWTEWLYNNDCETAKLLAEQLKADEGFKSWFKTQVKSIKNKKQRSWWNKTFLAK